MRSGSSRDDHVNGQGCHGGLASAGGSSGGDVDAPHHPPVRVFRRVHSRLAALDGESKRVHHHDRVAIKFALRLSWLLCLSVDPRRVGGQVESMRVDEGGWVTSVSVNFMCSVCASRTIVVPYRQTAQLKCCRIPGGGA
jgi:hypothetical protein